MGHDVPNREVKIVQLARSFGSLQDAPGVKGLWDALALDKWAASGVSSGQKHAARFVLGVWNSSLDWDCGKFCVFDAIDIWDEGDRAAFVNWVAAPWFA